MPTLDKLTSEPVVKMLLLGDSGTGKTGACASLVKDYDLRVLDMDNGWESLAAAVKRTAPDRMSSVVVESFRDKFKSSAAGPIFDGMPTAFVSALKLIDDWPGLGAPAKWGPKAVLLLDSLTFLGDAALNWQQALNPTAGMKGGMDKRALYGTAQDALKHLLALLTGAAFNCNVIITAHIRFTDMPDGTKKGYPTAVGEALGPQIGRFFNSVAQCETRPGGKRTIRTVSSAMVDLKNPASFNMAPELPIETGLADFFRTVKSGQTILTPSKVA